MLLIRYYWVISFCLMIVFVGCKERKVRSVKKKKQSTKELVVYCENTMLNLVVDLKQEFETQYKCNVIIQNDCSKNLMAIIEYSGKGDLYIPSSSHSFERFYDVTGQSLSDSLFLGYNHLVYMVKKGNPKAFTGYLSHLKRKKYALIIANAETSALGYETKRFLSQQRAYDQIVTNAISLTSDSKGLVKGLKDDHADVVINWRSNLYAHDNQCYVEVVAPQLTNNPALPIYAAVLSCSQEAGLAQAFLNLAASHLSEERLSNYGFSKRQTIIF